MREFVQREKVRFASGNTDCAAWHYPGTNGACVIMTGGMGVNKEPGTDRFAIRFQDSGFAVLAFDYRHIGESGGQPRQVVRIKEQLADWQAAICFAATLPGVTSPQAGDLEFLALRRPYLFRRGAEPTTGGGYRADAARRRPRCHAQRSALPDAAGHAALHLPGHPRCTWWPNRSSTAIGSPRRRTGCRRHAHHAGRNRRQSHTQPRKPVPGLAPRDRRPFGATEWPLPAWSIRTPCTDSATGPRVQRRSVRFGRARCPSGEAGASR
jgi:hypothetical protein